jgi:hypothetical protein
MLCLEEQIYKFIRRSEMMRSTFERFAGYCAVLAGIAGFLYSVAFIILRSDLLSALFLLLGGLFGSAALLALYERLRGADSTFVFWGFLFALIGVLGSAIHGGYDLSNALHPPSVPNTDLPNPIDPRGLLTFGFAGIGLFVLSWLILLGGSFPRKFGYLGYLSAFLMMILYLGRLVILQATSPVIVIPALLEGFIVNPAWYIWLGVMLLQEK